MKKCILFSLVLLLSLNIFAQVKPSSAVTYRVIIDREEQGPLTIDQVKQLITSGKIQRSSMMMQQGMSSWTEAEQIPEIYEIFKGIPDNTAQTDTMKITGEKKVVVKNSYYYHKKSKIHRMVGASLVGISLAVCLGTLSLEASQGKTIALYSCAGVFAVGILEWGIGLSLNSKAKKLAEAEKKVSLGPASTGLGLAIHF